MKKQDAKKIRRLAMLWKKEICFFYIYKIYTELDVFFQRLLNNISNIPKNELQQIKTTLLISNRICINIWILD